MSLVTIVLVAAVKGSVLLVAAWLAMRALPRMSAASRHLLWTSALGGLVLMPLLVGVVPSVQSRFVPLIPVVTSIQTNVVAPTASSRTSLRATMDAPPATVDGAPPPSDHGTAARDRSIDLRRWFPMLWAAVAMLLLLRLVFGRLRLSLVARRASVVDDGDWLLLVQRLAHRLEISRPITLLRSSRPCVPMTWGLVYPIVLLPRRVRRVADGAAHDRTLARARARESSRRAHAVHRAAGHGGFLVQSARLAGRARDASGARARLRRLRHRRRRASL